MSNINQIVSAVTDWGAMGVRKISSVGSKVLELKHNPHLERGLDIGWPHLDLRLKSGVYVVTGIPGSGKSVWLDNVLIRSIKNHHWKWMVFSPENNPVQNHVKDLVEILSGKQLRELDDARIGEAVDVLDNFASFIEPPNNEALKIENIMRLIELYHESNGINAFILDPYNEFSYTRPQGMSETEYVSLFMSEIRKITTKHELSCWIVAHPTKMRKNDDGKYPVPTAYDIAGSANFYNKADQIVCVHREKNPKENPDNITEIYVQKVKRKSNGTIGMCELRFDWKSNRFNEPNRYGEEDVPNYDKRHP